MYQFFITSNHSPSRNRLFRSPSPSRKGFNNSPYKGFIMVNNIHSEINFNKIPATYFKI